MGTSSIVGLFAFMHRQFKMESRWKLEILNRLEFFSITESEYANAAITNVTLVATNEFSINAVVANESVSELVVNIPILTRK